MIKLYDFLKDKNEYKLSTITITEEEKNELYLEEKSKPEVVDVEENQVIEEVKENINITPKTDFKPMEKIVPLTEEIKEEPVIEYLKNSNKEKEDKNIKKKKKFPYWIFILLFVIVIPFIIIVLGGII